MAEEEIDENGTAVGFEVSCEEMFSDRGQFEELLMSVHPHEGWRRIVGCRECGDGPGGFLRGAAHVAAPMAYIQQKG